MVKTLGVILAVGTLVAACAHAPKSEAKRSQLEQQASAELQEMLTKDPSLNSLLQQSAGYIVFPSVGQGGFIVGGAGGQGVLYENGQVAGFATLSQASFGAQVGGQKFAQLIVVRDRWQLDRMKAGQFDVGGQASATIIKAGAATAAQFGRNGLAVIVNPKGGAMLNVSLTGQKIKITM
jgi:lipid-binding SYLF domain-containing protein